MTPGSLLYSAGRCIVEEPHPGFIQPVARDLSRGHYDANVVWQVIGEQRRPAVFVERLVDSVYRHHKSALIRTQLSHEGRGRNAERVKVLRSRHVGRTWFTAETREPMNKGGKKRYWLCRLEAGADRKRRRSLCPAAVAEASERRERTFLGLPGQP